MGGNGRHFRSSSVSTILTLVIVDFPLYDSIGPRASVSIARPPLKRSGLPATRPLVETVGSSPFTTPRSSAWISL